VRIFKAFFSFFFLSNKFNSIWLQGRDVDRDGVASSEVCSCSTWLAMCTTNSNIIRSRKIESYLCLLSKQFNYRKGKFDPKLALSASLLLSSSSNAGQSGNSGSSRSRRLHTSLLVHHFIHILVLQLVSQQFMQGDDRPHE
jgi:hypothetical protein